MSATRRFFFALWPDAPERAALTKWGGEVVRVTGGRAMRADSLHLTLAFIGDIAADEAQRLRVAADRVTFDPFVLRIDRIGYFRPKRIAWAGADTPPQALLGLAAALREALHAENVRVDPQPFVAHVTLVRNAERMVAPPALPSFDWPVREIALVESMPVEGRREYVVRARWMHR